MHRRLHVKRVLLAAVAVLAFASMSWAQAGRIGGTVLDDTGKPIKGATVTATNPDASPSSLTATTDDKGRFSLLGLRSGDWAITAQAPGFASSQGKLKVETISVNPPVTFRLAKGGGGAAGGIAGVNSKELQAELEAAEGLYNSGQYDQAITAYQAILTKAPQLTIINLQIGNAYRMKKDYDKALASYQEVLKGEPSNERAKLQIGMTYLEKGDIPAAEIALTEAAAVPGASREVFYNLGEVKFAKNEPDEAAKMYQKAFDTDPSWGKPLFKLALVALNKGDKAGAVQYMEKVIAADPTSQEAAQAKVVLEQLKKS
jgi:tetratricopeptide (TPR) repeat protein